MPKTGFYNDNEYRAYPFIEKDIPLTRRQSFGAGDEYKQIKNAIHSVIVDAGFTLGIDCPIADARDLRICLESISVDEQSREITITFFSSATAHRLIFTAPAAEDDWITVDAQAGSEPCSTAPFWRGFIVVNCANTLYATLDALGFPTDETTGKKTFVAVVTNLFEFEIEPARVQNRARAYLRSINIGNMDRIKVPPCGEASSGVAERGIVPARTCMSGPIFLKEGYNCQISQIDRTRTFTVSARVGAGAQKDATYCQNYGEILLTPNEEKPADSKFYSGGPACDELIYTINGATGQNINLISGSGITISTESNKITVATRENFITACAPTAPEAP